MTIDNYQVTNQNFTLSNFSTKKISNEADKDLKEALYDNEILELRALHERLFAESKEGILVVLQALDASGKDEMIQTVFSNLKAQGVRVSATSKPTEEEKMRDYLWQTYQGLPKRGEIAILNRSYYEEIIAPQIHGSLEEVPLPERIDKRSVINKRYQHLKNFETYLYDNGFRVVKLFFHMSKKVQTDRFLQRLKDEKQQHEFSFSDLEDRQKWEAYQEVFEAMIKNTATSHAPWYILPADNPWLSRKITAQIIINLIKEINPQYPTFSVEEEEQVNHTIEKLENELKDLT